MLNYTRLSLYYVLAYLTMSGLSLFFTPVLTLKLFFSTGQYDIVFLRISGALLLVLALLVGQIIRKRLEALYLTVIGARIFLLCVWVLAYLQTRDPMFIIFFMIVAIGFILSVCAYHYDKAAQTNSNKP